MPGQRTRPPTTRKRGNNEGTVFQRKDGRWCAAVTLPEGGRKYVYGRTREQAADKLTDALAGRKDGTLLLGPNPTLREYLTTWLEDRRDGIKPWTYRGYRTQVGHIKDVLGHVKLQDMTADHVKALIRERKKVGKPKSVRYCHQVLRTALGDAVRSKRIKSNVADREHLGTRVLPKVERFKINPFTKADARAFLVAAVGDPLEPLYRLALDSGMRQAELLGLCWDRIDFDGLTVSVSASLQRQTTVYRVGDPKSDSSRRVIDVDSRTMASLRAHRAAQVAARLQAGPAWVGFEQDGETVDLVFTSDTGRPLAARNVTRSFKRFLTRHKLRDVRFHDLRHTTATLLFQAGEHPKVVQERLGHASIKITIDTYSHIIPAMQRRAAERLAEMLN